MRRHDRDVLTQANRPFDLLNGIFLLFLTFLPFPTGLHAVYFGDKLAANIDGGAHILSAVSLLRFSKIIDTPRQARGNS